MKLSNQFIGLWCQYLTVTSLAFLCCLVLLSCKDKSMKDTHRMKGGFYYLHDYDIIDESISITNIKTKYHDSFNIYYTLLNVSEQPVYVLVSDWYVHGLKNRYSYEQYWIPSTDELNSIYYEPRFPSFKKVVQNRFGEVHPMYNNYPTVVKLDPKETRNIHLVLDREFYTRLKWTMNCFRFKIQHAYFNKYNWDELNSISELKLDKYIRNRTTKSIKVNLNKDGLTIYGQVVHDTLFTFPYMRSSNTGVLYLDFSPFHWMSTLRLK